ncbi:patatin-like phospholipase family protein [Clostridium estertheticum]|uniref:Patatin-like phospholipase family protein n=1 Tax=Clostridium estertheticum TaxID=238834 RepID=A0A7Y3WUP3_9CLOT|nr:patatin-like phospholipase family protein [Clostridium estertheticum]NNU78298.1 patatin-like phospholipase family protein [Clostridium estertheticum]WBL45766.1 patatin-like phospholipase family protein [Clostridium estertheticum]
MNIYSSIKFADIVFEGGGVKGIGLVGALKPFEQKGYHWKNICGNSAGSIVAALVAVGYSSDEIKKLMIDLDYTKIADKNYSIMPFFSNANNLLFKKGLFKGDYIKNWIDDALSNKLKLHSKKKVTFGDLIIPDEKGILLNNEKYKRKYKLHIIATDISRGKMIILPEDIAEYGINPDEFEVGLAIRMSISIPYFFQPVKLFKKNSNRKSLIVDGGVLSNYPVWIFDVNGIPDWPTIGFKLGGNKEIREHKITNILNFTSSIIETMLEAQDDIHISEMDFLRTVKIDTLDIKTTDFNIESKKIIDLYNSGEVCARDFLQTFESDFKKHRILRVNSLNNRTFKRICDNFTSNGIC